MPVISFSAAVISTFRQLSTSGIEDRKDQSVGEQGEQAGDGWRESVGEEIFSQDEEDREDEEPLNPGLSALVLQGSMGSQGLFPGCRPRVQGKFHAGVAHKDHIRVFLAIVNFLDLELDQVDIKAAFLNGELQEISISSLLRGVPFRPTPALTSADSRCIHVQGRYRLP